MLRPENVSSATADAIRTLLVSLHARIPLKLWMVTSIEGQEWQQMFVHNVGCNLTEAQVNDWLGRFCERIIASNAHDTESFVDEGGGDQNGADSTIKAYIGVPLVDDYNVLIGTLCGIDPEPDVAGIRSGEALVRQTATLLSRLIAMEAHVATQRRLASKLSDSAHRDDLTGLLNRRGWDDLMRQTRSWVGKEIQGVIVVDIGISGAVGAADDAGGLLHRAASALTVSMRGQDAVARLGDHSFGILLRCDGVQMVQSVVARIEQELAAAAVSAITGFSTSPPALSLEAAFISASAMTMQRKQALSSAN
jgi:GGDEF domain-containing protein